MLEKPFNAVNEFLNLVDLRFYLGVRFARFFGFQTRKRTPLTEAIDFHSLGTLEYWMLNAVGLNRLCFSSGVRFARFFVFELENGHR